MKRANKSIITLIVATAVFALAVTGLQVEKAGAADKVYTLKIQSLFPEGDLSANLLDVFAESAAKHSNGQLKIEVYSEPELVPGDQLFGATRHGVVDMLQGMGGMWAGIVPVGNVEFNLPLAFRIPDSEAETFEGKAEVIRDFFMEEGFIEILRKEYAKHDLYMLDICTFGPVPFVLSTEPVKTCEDLEGMKIKADGINRTYHAKVGMRGAEVSPTEAYAALKLGTVDAAEWDVSCVTGFNWHEVAPYWIRGMECHHATGHILVNMKKWKSLPDELQTALEKAGEDYWHATVEGYKNEIETVRDLVEKGEVKEIMLSESCREEYAKGAHEIWDELAQQGPACAEAIELIREWREDFE